MFRPNDLTIDQLREMEATLCEIVVPPDMRMSRRKIASNFNQLTSDDWRIWTLGVSQLLLHFKITSPTVRENWMHFVRACRLISLPSVRLVDVEEADKLFREFGRGIGRIYGKHTVSINAHLHTHLLENIKDFGSVYGFWCLPFER
ncbi:hypothetical protein BC940DRAFT_245084, partial [Gongronella butleri]